MTLKDRIIAATQQLTFVGQMQAEIDTSQSTADEAKATADALAASMSEYMDALLGLDATDETEATDAE